jgi:AcrR family transcriptional regulator
MLSNPQIEEKLDPRVKRTRQLLEQAFRDLLAEKGFDAINVQDVTDRAGVNRATFYAHFQDKFDLLDYSIREAFRLEIKTRLLHSCHFSLQNLHQLIVAVCKFTRNMSSHCVGAQRQFGPLAEKQIKEQLYELILMWMKQSMHSLSPETSATAASWAIYGLAMQWNQEKKTQSAEAFADEVLPIIAGNLNLAQTAIDQARPLPV